MIIQLKPSSTIADQDDFSPQASRKYIVYAIKFPADEESLAKNGVHQYNRKTSFFIVVDDDITKLYPFSANEFDVIDGELPGDWSYGSYHSNGAMAIIGFAAILEEFFLERLTDGEEVERGRFQKFVDKYNQRWGHLL